MGALLSEVIWSNIISAIPPTLLALGALIASIRGRRTVKRVEEKINGSLDTMMEKLSDNIKLVSDTRVALETSISSHEAQIEMLKAQLEIANTHINKLILPGTATLMLAPDQDQLEKALVKHDEAKI